jgi:hypothetical protein
MCQAKENSEVKKKHQHLLDLPHIRHNPLRDVAPPAGHGFRVFSVMGTSV